MSDDEKKSPFGMIFTVLLIAGAVGYFYYRQKNDAPDELKEARKDPEQALMIYLKVAYGFIHHDPIGTYDTVESMVTKEDWSWFLANYDSLKFDWADISSAVDPNEARAVGKRTALMAVLAEGADRPGPVLPNKKIGPDEAIFYVKECQDDQGQIYADIKCRVVKEDGVWKVAGFAGGRAMITHQTQKDDFIESTRFSGLEAPGAKPAGTPGAAAPPPAGSAATNPAASPGVSAAPSSAASSVPPAAGSGSVPSPFASESAVPPAAPAAVNKEENVKAADRLIDRARQDWDAKDYSSSLRSAKAALDLYKTALGGKDPKVATVEGMIKAAQAKVDEAANPRSPWDK